MKMFFRYVTPSLFLTVLGLGLPGFVLSGHVVAPEERLSAQPMPMLLDSYRQDWDREQIRLPTFGSLHSADKNRRQLAAQQSQAEFSDLLIAARGVSRNSKWIQSRRGATQEGSGAAQKGSGAVQKGQKVKKKPPRAKQHKQQRSSNAASSAGSASKAYPVGKKMGQARAWLTSDLWGKELQWYMDYSQAVYQSISNTLLLEVGGRSKDKDYLVAGGVIYRYGRGGYVVGLNGFIDRNQSTVDLTGDKMRESVGADSLSDKQLKLADTRGSVGIEWKTPWWGIDSNFYSPLLRWKNDRSSPAFDFAVDKNTYGLQRQPARGFDVSLEGRLVHTSLSFKVGYSHWLNDYVDLDRQRRQTFASPKSKMLTVSWQPISLLKLSISHTFLSAGYLENRLQIELCLDMKKNSRDIVRLTPSVATAWARSQEVRYAFVNRNVDMVMAYQFKQGRALKAGNDVTLYYSDGSFTQPAKGDSGCPISYLSSNPDVATVDASGTVTLLKAGVTNILSTQAATGPYEEKHGSYTLTVLKSKDTTLVAGDLFGLIGQKITVPVLECNDGKREFVSNHPKVVNVDVVLPDGKAADLKLKSQGEARITVTETSDYYKDQTSSILVTSDRRGPVVQP